MGRGTWGRRGRADWLAMGGVAIAAAVVFAAWVYLAVLHGGYWRTNIRLGRHPDPAVWPPVAIVVPARNEADMLPVTLPSLLAQDYAGHLDIVVVDDHSDDGTGDVAASVVANLPVNDPANRPQATVLRGAPRPDGWAGKLWALHQGTTASPTMGGPRPAYFLFTDADIAHPPDSVSRLVAAAEDDHRDLVSLMARLRVDTGWERLLIPAFVYFFAQLYPFRRVSRPGRTAAAAGGCVLVRRAALEAAGGIAAIKDALIDDVTLATRLKRTGASVWLGLADDVRSVRPYPRVADVWLMVARSAYTQLRYSPALLAGTVVGLAALYLFPLAAVVAGAATGHWWALATGAAGLVLMTATYLPMTRYCGLALPWAATLPLAATLYGAMTVDSARRHWMRGGVDWKGRQYEHSAVSGAG